MYLPMNAIGDEAVNNLTGRTMDQTAHTPAYKELSVKMEKLGEPRGESPLPKTNPRFAHPKPQKGVLVEEKWARKDYSKLTTE
jgi:formate dehydrogenase major subunit